MIITDTRAHAMEWKDRLQTFLQSKMKLTLSQEKTLITDVRRKRIKFLGYELKMVRGKSKNGYITRTAPDGDRLKRKVDNIAENIKKIPKNYSRERLVNEINWINSQIRYSRIRERKYFDCCFGKRAFSPAFAASRFTKCLRENDAG